jgi:hypothetical protein
MSERLQVGEVYHAIINGVATMIVVSAVIPPSRQGGVGDERYRVRNLQGRSDEIEIRATAVIGRCKFTELMTWLLEQGWKPKDIADYLDSYGVKYAWGSVSSYASNFSSFGSCTAPSGMRVKSSMTEKLQARASDNGIDRLTKLQNLLSVLGGVSQTDRALTMIECFGGVAEVRRFLNLLRTN